MSSIIHGGIHYRLGTAIRIGLIYSNSIIRPQGFEILAFQDELEL